MGERLGPVPLGAGTPSMSPLPATDGELLRPEWVILGVKTTDGVNVYASSTLSRAEMEAEVRHHQATSIPGGFARRAPIAISYRLRVAMGSFVVVWGPDYPTALRELLNHWSPGEDPMGEAYAIGASMPEPPRELDRPTG